MAELLNTIKHSTGFRVQVRSSVEVTCNPICAILCLYLFVYPTVNMCVDEGDWHTPIPNPDMMLEAHTEGDG